MCRRYCFYRRGCCCCYRCRYDGGERVADLESSSFVVLHRVASCDETASFVPFKRAFAFLFLFTIAWSCMELWVTRYEIRVALLC